MPRLLTRVIAMVTLLLVASFAQAIPLDLPAMSPDIYSGNISVSYNASTDIFQANGMALSFNDGTLGSRITAATGQPGLTGTFGISVVVDGQGVVQSGPLTSDLTITGTTTGGEGGNGTLLQGTLTQFGFTPDGTSGAPTFDFLFQLTGGALAQDFGGIGSLFGVDLSTGSIGGWTGTFLNDYSGNHFNADTFGVVPEPASMALLSLGVVGIVIRKCRKASVRSAAEGMA